MAPIFLVLSCNNSARVASESRDSTSSMTQKNLEANNVISNAFETGDVSKIDNAVASDFVDHSDRGDIRGTDSLKAMVTMIHNNMKDMKMETIKDMADGDYVFSWMRFSGNSNGSMGMPAGPYDMQAVEVSKFKDGKATEHWEFMDIRDVTKMMKQMQNMGNRQTMPPMDTTKMKKK